ncbi:hypothetical protein [Bosea sp. RAC05]|uniref:hypothetical protein n=1 Tax=Bosea sp. RAC05 TaxID=1842539 RepID=UPI0008587876|nr:hypothetical protein [Bosea sp. RAC05]AOG03472.1 hypothetical protein BSY19_4707 [Bosea sp. RAC05]
MLSLGWLERNGAGLIAHDEAMSDRARVFVLDRWIERDEERARELAALAEVSFDDWVQKRGWRAPSDLTNACKFASLFAKLIFGGSIAGNEKHQFNLINGRIVDLTAGSSGLAGMKGAYRHDPIFFGNDDHLASLVSCMPRVREWADDFTMTHAPSSWMAPAKTRHGQWELRVGWRRGGREEFSLDFTSEAARDLALAQVGEALGAGPAPDGKGLRLDGRLLTPEELAVHLDPDTVIRVSPSCAKTAAMMQAMGVDTGPVTDCFDRKVARRGASAFAGDFMSAEIAASR